MATNDVTKEYVSEIKNDQFYRLTANVEDASEEEAKEILADIEELSDDDLAIASVKSFKT